MKSLIRWSATLGLVGATLAGAVLSGALEVLALTPDQIMQKLRPVPVFTIANSEGAPLVASPQNGQKGNPVAGVFITQQDAQAFLNNLKTRNPDIAKNVKVVPISLAEVYKLNTANQGKADKDKLLFTLVPSRQQVDTAQTLLKQSGEKEQFNGTPLFVARGGPDKGYLTIQQGDKAVIPMFFKREELQSLIDRFKQQDPKIASTLEIQVLNLEGVLEVMRTKNDPQLDQIMLIPPRESLEFVRSTLGNQQPQAKPASAPAAKPAPKK
ncbi:MAG: Tic22 family protein [Leptolyngbyaceae cyanobacterium bins.302]|nr:Tic22 family protein [Leptolyngbyaceae cyanobacterium bins.302]